MYSTVVVLALLFGFSSATPFRLVEDLALDTEGTEAEIGSIMSIAVAPDGTIYVGDFGFGTVHVFDDDGAHLRSFGETGEAPGDLPQMFNLAVDAEGTLVVGGMRDFIAWLDPFGEPIRTVKRGDGSHYSSDLEFAAGGRIVLSYGDVGTSAPDEQPTLVKVLSAGGEELVSFGHTEAWKIDMPPHWSGMFVRGRVTVEPGGETVLVVASQPFALHRYTIEGELLASTTEAVGNFLPPVAMPEVKGTTTIFRVSGSAEKAFVLADGRIVLTAYRRDQGDWPVDQAPPAEYRSFVFESDLTFLGEVEIPGWPFAMDPEGRFWCADRDADVPVLRRYRVED